MAATIDHSTLTGTQLHEPKGVASASSGSVYIATGTGTGNWGSPLSGINNVNVDVLTMRLPAILTAGSAYITVPWACNLLTVYATLQATITGNAPTITASIGGTPVGGLSVVIANNGPVGTSYGSNASGANSLTAGQVLQITSTGASGTGSVDAELTLVFLVT